MTTTLPTYGEMRTETEKQIDAVLLQRVKDGIAILEERYGDGWVEQFGGLEDFRIRSVAKCVLGKVYGDYRMGMMKLGLVSRDCDRLGFNLPDNESIEAEDRGAKRWEELQATWVFELRERGVQ